ncbi:hypothetical protein FQN53_009448 [Emmonsiellopsis sp. PD_33]|nr:hypothetical protein FQN53_009448 [Emmonsiellopsis sp. PD_33]
MAPALALLLRGGEPQTAATAVAAANSTSDVITIASHGIHRHTGSHVIIALRVVVSFLAFLVLLVCGFRLYLRKFVLRKFDLNDVLVVISLVLTLGFNALSLVWTAFGGGSHVYEVSPETVAIFYKIYFAAMVSYLLVGMSIKLSLLTFLKEVFPKVAWLNNASTLQACPHAHTDSGLIACIAALLRFSTLRFVLKADYTYLLAYALICSNVEFNVALVAGSLPSLRILMGIDTVLAPRRASQEPEAIFPVITRGRSVELRKMSSRMTEPLSSGRRSSGVAGGDLGMASREFYSQFGEVGEEAMAGMSGLSDGEGSTSGGEGETRGRSASPSGRAEGEGGKE